MKNLWTVVKSLNQVRQAWKVTPKELPQQIGAYLITRRSMDPDAVWKLRCVLRPTGLKNRYDFRVFNPDIAAVKKIRVNNFEALDNHPELILFKGDFHKYSNEVRLTEDSDRPAA